jgi:hypothetical protein
MSASQLILLAAVTLLQDQPVSAHGINLFSTPIALCRGALVVASVEDQDPPGNRVRTVLRVGGQRAIVEDRTLIDDYHTQPSVGVDPLGRIHIAYNMHNMPWQYAVGREPCSIDALEFRGEPLNEAQLREVAEYNRTPFPGGGHAAIPGNQVTYPAFFNDRNGDLYVTYRYAVRPDRAWLERAFGAGVARLNAATGEWSAVGGPAEESRPFAWEPGWTVYPARLWFDVSNAMHVTWTWREKQAGPDTTHPSYAVRTPDSDEFRRADGTRYGLPIRLTETGGLESDRRVYAITSVTTQRSAPLVVLAPVGGERVLMAFDPVQRQWRSQGLSPFGASSVLCDDDGTCWAYASGPRVLIRKPGAETWQTVYEGQGYCDPKPLHDWKSGRHLVHVTRCDQRAISVLEFDARPPRS